MNKTASTPKRIMKVSAGFSLLETITVVFILAIIVGAVFRQVQKAQTHYRVESQKLDFTEQQRAFLDEFTRDLHQAGYPTPASLGPGAGPNLVASPVVTIAGNSLTMEGDLDGTGVQVVTYDYNAANLTLERTAAPKGGAAGAPVVAVQNVLAPTANQPLFMAYDAAGNSPPLGPVKAVTITFTAQGAPDASGKKMIQTTMTATARLPNF